MCIYVPYHITHTCSRHAAVLSDTSEFTELEPRAAGRDGVC